MITDADAKKIIKKIHKVFASKTELKSLEEKMNFGFAEIIHFIGDTRTEIVDILDKNLIDLQEIARRQQILLENHESRITHLEYVNKS